MSSYCNIIDVSNELNGLTIDSSTTPSSTTVNIWIEQESDLLNRETNKIWGNTTITEEILDYDGSGVIRTNYAPIISIDSLYYDNGSTSANWVELTEGKYNDFLVYNTEGEIVLTSNNIGEGKQKIKITYDAGYSDTNTIATMIVSKRVALRVMSTILNESGTAEGGSIQVDVISISDPSTFSINNIMRLQGEVKDLINSLGSFKVYRYNR